MDITIQFCKHKDKYYVGRVKEYPSFFGFGMNLDELKKDCLAKTNRILDGTFHRIDKVILDAVDSLGGDQQNKIGFSFEYNGLPYFPNLPKDKSVEDITRIVRTREGYDNIDPTEYKRWLREEMLRDIEQKERRKKWKEKKKLERLLLHTI